MIRDWISAVRVYGLKYAIYLWRENRAYQKEQRR